MSLFKKKSTESDGQENQGTAKSKGSLLVLLVLLGGFAYLYFFTSLIVPHEVPAPKAPDVSAEVKQSMPPKPTAQPASSAVPAAPKPDEAKPAVPPALPPAAKPTAPAAAAPTAAKPAAPAPSLPSQTGVKAAAPVPAPVAPKQEPTAAVKKEEAKPGKAAEQKPAQAVQPKAAAKSEKAPAPGVDKAAVRKQLQQYTVFAGVFPAGEEAAAAEAKLAKLGVKPVARQETKKSKSMNRLFYGAYTDYDVYSADLEKLKQSAKGAFGVEKDGTYYLYAGSFSSKERGEKEKRDLSAKGVKLQLQPVVFPLSTIRLTAGSFASKGEADKVAARMKAAGLAAKVVVKGR